MTTPNPYQVPDFSKTFQDTLMAALQEKLTEKAQEQSWYQKYSNTATTAVSGLVTLAGWISAQQLDLPPTATYIIGALLFIGSMLGIKGTNNGITTKTTVKVTQPDVMAAVAAEGEKFLAQQLEAVRVLQEQATAAVDESIGRHRNMRG